MALEGSWQHAAPTGDSWTEEEALDLINRNPGCSLENGGAGLTTTERDPDNNLPGSPTAPPPGSSPSNDGSYLCYYALRAIVEGKFVTWDPPISYLSLVRLYLRTCWSMSSL